MVENIVFIILVILAIGAGVWVWHMEVSGTPVAPPSTPAKSADTSEDNPLPANKEESA